MCLVVLAYKVHPAFPLIVLANRDEFLDRPALPAHAWQDAPHIFAGRDLQAGGTWLGVTRSGRFAALTNYRDLTVVPRNGPSRGALVRRALDQDIAAADTVEYERFNLIHGEVDALRYINNVDGADRVLEPGVHGLSNHLLDTPWPKVERAKKDLSRIISSSAAEPTENLFAAMMRTDRAPDEHLPDTGVPLELERALSAAFISLPGYGTRCTTLVTVNDNGRVFFEERGHVPPGRVRYSFPIERSA